VGLRTSIGDHCGDDIAPVRPHRRIDQNSGGTGLVGALLAAKQADLVKTGLQQAQTTRAWLATPMSQGGVAHGYDKLR